MLESSNPPQCLKIQNIAQRGFLPGQPFPFLIHRYKYKLSICNFMVHITNMPLCISNAEPNRIATGAKCTQPKQKHRRETDVYSLFRMNDHLTDV